MSRAHRKNLKRGIKQPLVAREQRVRASRHGKPHTHRVFRQEQRIVAPGTPNAKRTVEAIEPGVVYPEGTVFMDGMAVVHRLTVSVAHQAEVRTPITRAVPAGPTGTVGMKNEPPKKSVAKVAKR